MGNNLRWMCVLLLAVSVIFAGILGTHAAEPQLDGHGDHNAISHNLEFQDGERHVNPVQENADCDEQAEDPVTGPISEHTGKGSCCLGIHLPTFAMWGGLDGAVQVFYAVCILPHVERIVVLHIPATLLRPPRIRV